MAMKIQSNAFVNGGLIPQKFTCDGQNISPQLSWKDTPAQTQSFVLIMDDPDAPSGYWVHWILYNIPPSSFELSEAISQMPQGTLKGLNSWSKKEYGGPCPPDKSHRYYFKLYALDQPLALPEGASKEALEKAMASHVLAHAELMGQYKNLSSHSTMMRANH